MSIYSPMNKKCTPDMTNRERAGLVLWAAAGVADWVLAETETGLTLSEATRAVVRELNEIGEDWSIPVPLGTTLFTLGCVTVPYWFYGHILHPLKRFS